MSNCPKCGSYKISDNRLPLPDGDRFAQTARAMTVSGRPALSLLTLLAGAVAHSVNDRRHRHSCNDCGHKFTDA